MNQKLTLILIGWGCLALSACQSKAFSTQTPQPEGAYKTAAAQTLIAQLTQAAAGENTSPEVPTSTPRPTNTLAPSSTPIPSATPVPTATPYRTSTTSPTPSATVVLKQTPDANGVYCNWAEFVNDVTIADHTVLLPGTPFTKTWRLKNVGTCTWTRDYSLVFINRDLMGGKPVIFLPHQVKPGETIDLSVNLVAPQRLGDYQGNWMLQDDNGMNFGTNANAEGVFWVKITVGETNTNVVYDFLSNYCQAIWTSGAGRLPCPGTAGSKDGFALRVDNPYLETSHENEPALWTNPEKVKKGWITGTYPEIEIRSGYHFLADVGCLADNSSCNVLFKLKYQVNGGEVKTLDEWREVYDGSITKVDINLSQFAKMQVTFILSVESSNATEENAAFWLIPQIWKPDE